jgi:hypothetical protein
LGWWGDVIVSKNYANIGSDKALGGENINQQMMGVMAVMATGWLTGNDNANDVQPCLPNTQQPARHGGWRGGDKDDKEEEYDGCWRMEGKVASALAKRRGGAIVSCVAFGEGGTLLWMSPSNGGQRQQKWLKTMYAFLSRGTHGGDNEQKISNRGG